MEYKELVSVTGIGGLFQLVNTKADGAIVKSLTDQTVKFISARQHQVTPLESIEIFTHSDNIRLHKIFELMTASVETIPDAKASDQVIATYFKSVFPDMDETRVYSSDRKKILKWYVILKANNLLDFSKIDTPPTPVVEDAPIMEETAVIEEKPKKKAATKKKVEENTAAVEEKPKKKATPKKKAE